MEYAYTQGYILLCCEWYKSVIIISQAALSSTVCNGLKQTTGEKEHYFKTLILCQRIFTSVSTSFCKLSSRDPNT